MMIHLTSDMFNLPASQQFRSNSQFDFQRCLNQTLMHQRLPNTARFSSGSDQSAQSPPSSANSSPISDPYELDLNWNKFFRLESAAVLNGRIANALANLVASEDRSSKPNESIRPVWQPTGKPVKFNKPNGSPNELPGTAFENLMALADRIWWKLVRQMKLERKSKKAKPSSSKATKCCKFCKNNSEPRSFFTNHSTRNPKGEITCPVLMKHVCEICNATGKFAHTRSYCPFSKVIRNSVDDVKLSYKFHNMKLLNSRD